MALASAGEHLHTGQKVALWFQKFGLPDSVVLICVFGNMLPIAPTLLGLRSRAVRDCAAPLLKRAEKKLAKLPTGQSRWLALMLFVGIPAPGTGAWTGAIIAFILDMPFAEAMWSILAGVIVAGLIMTLLTLAGKAGA